MAQIHPLSGHIVRGGQKAAIFVKKYAKNKKLG